MDSQPSSAAARTSVSEADQKPVCRPFPKFTSLTSLVQLWQLYDEGWEGQPSLKRLEQAAQDDRSRSNEVVPWRAKYRQQWHKVATFVAKVNKVLGERQASSNRGVISAMDVVKGMDDERRNPPSGKKVESVAGFLRRLCAEAAEEKKQQAE
jgi:hypothetical protein